MSYLATINTPGYLPMDDDPPVFETAEGAWEYLADERKRGEDDTEEVDDGYSATVNILEQAATGTMDAFSNAGLAEDGTGTVYGNTPGYEGEHDLGLAYSVTLTEEEAQ